MEHTELRNLFALYMEGDLSPSEYEQLSEAAQSHTISDWQEAISPLIENTTTTEAFDKEEWQEIIDHILQQRVQKPTKTIAMKWWLRRIAAAVIILMLGTGTYFLFFNRTPKKEIVINIPVQKNDATPGRDGAILTIADGKTFNLDSTKNGSLTLKENMQVLKENGMVSYEGTDKTKVEYHTMSTPRGRKFELVLADGTKVWMNAESSVSFPTAFVGNERKVEITGEVYFEAAHNEAMPFIAQKGDLRVQVLGTHFNINTYEDEMTIRTTLLEGSVKVTKGNQSVVIKPGQQAQVNEKGELKISSDVDIDEVMAWKNGQFKFNNADIQTIMRQVSRWYDLDVVYEHGVPDGHYRGTASRDVKASQMLEIIRNSGVKFRIEGKKLIIE